MVVWTDAIVSEDVTWSDKFRDEPALSAFSDWYVASFADGLTAYTNINYNDTTWTDNISAEDTTRTNAISYV